MAFNIKDVLWFLAVVDSNGDETGTAFDYTENSTLDPNDPFTWYGALTWNDMRSKPGPSTVLNSNDAFQTWWTDKVLNVANPSSSLLGQVASDVASLKTTTPAHTHAHGDITDFATAVNSLVTSAINALLAGAPTALDTLKELADAMNDDANFAATVTSALGNKVDKASGFGLSKNDFTDALLAKLNAITTRAFHTPTFSEATTAAQLSTTRDAEVSYAFDAVVAISVLGGQSINAVLSYADNVAMTTNPVVVDANGTGQTGLAGLSNTQTLKVSGFIPAGKYRQVTFVLAKTGTAATPAAPTTIKAGQEVLV